MLQYCTEKNILVGLSWDVANAIKFLLIKHELSRNNRTNNLVFIHRFILMCQITYGFESLLSKA